MTSITAESKRNHSTPFVPPFYDAITNLHFCYVSVRLNHPSANDNVLVEVWLPVTRDGWNGRFQATGGGGFATGLLSLALAPAVKDGYAVSSTDGGHTEGYFDLDWAVAHDAEQGSYTVNYDLLQNWATRSLADQVYVGKSITEQYFKEKPHHSY